jgi:hydrogenase nickel incorporation protein HypA/HybF
MHERSLVKTLLRHVNQVAAENHACNVLDVTVQIGPLSGVEVGLVESAFNELANTIKLNIVETALVIECLECNRVSELPGFFFRCPGCDSGRVQVISGDEFRLVSLTIGEGTGHG